jgi:hypothetical protein
MDTPESFRKGRKMGTQLQPTPVLYGKDAEAVLKEINIKLPSEKAIESEARSEFFKNIKKKGL